MKKVTSKSTVVDTPITSLVQLVDSDGSKVLEKVQLISEASMLADACKASNDTLEDEQRAAILHDYVTNLWYKIELMKNWQELIHWNWVLWYNVSYKWKKVWIFKTFTKDSNVVFQPYWNWSFIKTWKLTASWVKSIKRVEA